MKILRKNNYFIVMYFYYFFTSNNENISWDYYNLFKYIIFIDVKSIFCYSLNDKESN